MKVEVLVARAGARRWHLRLRDELARRPGTTVRLCRAGEGEPLERTAAALLTLERTVLYRGRPTALDPVAVEPVPGGFTPDVVIDLTGSSSQPARSGAPRLRVRPTFDGDPSENAAVAALLAGALPEIALEDSMTGEVVASGRAAVEGDPGLTGALTCTLSRVVTLCGQLLESEDLPRPRAVATPRPAPRRSPGLTGLLARRLARDCARAIYHLCFHSPHWRIGWRWHDGPGLVERGDLGGPRWTVLRDPGLRFFADPFPVTWQGRTAVFFEDLDHRVGRGMISGIAFGPDGPIGDVFPVLDEPWHMSYPFVTEHDGALWMVPESSGAGIVPLYRCVEFPKRWERAGTLLEGIEAADCTIFRHDGRLWMMSAVRRGFGGYSDTLAIHYADRLLGPWREHARRPALVDAASARPAGAVVRSGDVLHRPVQDCTNGYGRALNIARVDRLTPEDFEQTIVARIAPGPLWPGGRLHTLNRSGPLECIDGTTYNPRLSLLRPLADARMKPAPGRVMRTAGNGVAS